MAGTYIEGSSKVLSGVYTLIQSVVTGIPLGDRGIVAYPFTADWGPVNKLDQVLFGGEFDKKYNASGNENLTAKLIYDNAWKGKPARVLTYRMATEAAAKGTVTLQDSGAADSLVLETKYPSARPFEVTVKDSLTGSGKTIQIIENGIKLAEVEGETVAELEEELNATDYVTVTSTGDNLPENITGATFTGGANGDSVTSTEYSDFLDAVEANGKPQGFSLDGVSDEAIISTVEAWTKRVRDQGLYITFASGGPSTWDSDIEAANTASTNFNHRGIVNVGNGVDGYTAAEMAVFVAARVASIPLNRTVTDVVIDYDSVNKELLPGDRVKAKEAGTLVFVHDSDGMVVIDEGVNTLTAPSGGEHEYMGKIRVNNALDFISKDLEAFGNEYKKTKSNTQEARQTYASLVEDTYFRALAAMEVIKDEPGFRYSYIEDPEYHGENAVYSPALDEAYFVAEFTPVDSMERIYQKFLLRF